MKRIIEEIRYQQSSKYKVSYYGSDNNLIQQKSIYINIKHVNIKGFTYILIFDNGHHLLEKAYRYLNVFKSKLSLGSRMNIAYSIKCYYEFKAIYEIQNDELEYDDTVAFANFLSGISANDNLIYINRPLSTQQICILFNKIKRYLSFIRAKDSAQILEYTISQIDVKKVRNLQNSNCPAFISVNQMKQIHKYVINDKTLNETTRAEYDCLYRIMFYAGLRAGEALGLTLEDFTLIRNQRGQIYYKVYIHNRTSDNRDQLAKRCMNVIDKALYKTNDYTTNNIGYQIVLISKSLYDDIESYYIKKAMEFQKSNKKMPIADSVNGNETNHYIFANNTKSTPLSRDIFERYTREMFKNLNIQVDTKVRTNNLLHRFRHGYAMYLLYVKKIPKSEVKHYTRHRSDESLSVYDNPTQEMRQEMLTKLMEGLDEYIIDKKNNK